MAVRRFTRSYALPVPPAPSAGGTSLVLAVPPETDLSGALCRTVHPDVFFPETDDIQAEAVAKAVCARCPVRAACLALALTRSEPVGIYGGLTPAERDVLAGRTNGCGTYAGYQRHQRFGDRTCAACRAAHNATNVRRRAARASRQEVAA